MGAISELFFALVGIVERGGKVAAGLVLLVGTLLIPAGYWLAFVLPGPDYYWPYMLIVSVLGVGMAGVGAATFLGSQAKMSAMARALDNQGEEDGPEFPAASEARTLPVPFWACASCKIAAPGRAMAERCMNCGSITDFLQVDAESERSLALAMMGVKG